MDKTLTSLYVVPNSQGVVFVVDTAGNDSEFLCYLDDREIHDRECVVTGCPSCANRASVDIECDVCGYVNCSCFDDNWF